MIALSCEGIWCARPDWASGPSRVEGVSLEFEESLVHAIRGAPGSGKTLLLHVLGLLELPDRGAVAVFGEDAGDWDEPARRAARDSVFGYLFPTPCLLPELTVAENVAMPLFRFSETGPDAAEERVGQTLELVGIGPLAAERAGDLTAESGALAALARALVHRPRILVAVAGEGSERAVFPALRRAVESMGLTCLWAQVGRSAPVRSDREIFLDGGRVARPTGRKETEPA